MATPASGEAKSKDSFFRHFQEKITEIQTRIASLEKTSPASRERTDAMESCLAGITSLSNEVLDLSSVIPPYDQRIYAQALKTLQENFDETRQRITPKRRFQFKSTPKASSLASQSTATEGVAKTRSEVSSVDTLKMPKTTTIEEKDSVNARASIPSSTKDYNLEMSQQQGVRPRQPSFSQATNINISVHQDMHIILPTTASRATSSGTVTKMYRCIVDMSKATAHGTPFAGLTMQDIQGCLIVAGDVAGAAHITGVQNSIILVASRQVRMHDCKNVDVYLQCASRPIIEDCRNVRFAPIPDAHKASIEKPVDNKWDQVDDFKWLKSEPSPNWSVLPEECRLEDRVWQEVLPGGSSIGLEDIFKEIGINQP